MNNTENYEKIIGQNEVHTINEEDEESSLTMKLPNLFLCGKNLGLNRIQLISASILSLAYFLNWAYFSLFAPFFPAEGLKKGQNTTQTGIIFGVFQLVLLLCSPFFGKYLNTIGVKFLVTSGLFLSAGSMISFGFLNDGPSGFIYFIMCVASRSITALGASMTLSYAIVGYFFPKNIATVVGFLEIFTGFGLMVGPVIGGALFEIGGFKMPFISMGVATGILFIVAFLIFPVPEVIKDKTTNKTSLPLLPLLKIFQFDISLFMLFCGSLAINFIEPSIQIHLLPLDLSPIQLGLVFLIPAGTYVCVTPFVGYFCDKYPSTMPWFMMISSFVSALAYCFFGPLPWFNLKLRLPVFGAAYTLFGISFSGLIIPVYAELTKIAKFHGYPPDLRTQGLISGIFSSIYSVGGLLGPILGGVVVDTIGFDMATFFMVILFVVTGFVYTLTYFLNGRKYNEPSLTTISTIDANATESSKLLNNNTDIY